VWREEVVTAHSSEGERLFPALFQPSGIRSFEGLEVSPVLGVRRLRGTSNPHSFVSRRISRFRVGRWISSMQQAASLGVCVEVQGGRAGRSQALVDCGKGKDGGGKCHCLHRDSHRKWHSRSLAESLHTRHSLPVQSEKLPRGRGTALVEVGAIWTLKD